MLHFHYIHWVLDFLGINNTYDSFSTHMYNFWSGFGANVSLLAVSGAIVGVYRHYNQRLNAINPINLVHKVEVLEKEKMKKKEENSDDQKPHQP